MNLPGSSVPIALAVLVGGLIVLGLAFVVEGTAFLVLGLVVGIAVGVVIAVASRADDRSR
jgi:hypothetical protein